MTTETETLFIAVANGMPVEYEWIEATEDLVANADADAADWRECVEGIACTEGEADTIRFFAAVERGSYDTAAARLDDLGTVTLSYEWVDAHEEALDALRRRGATLDTSDTDEARLTAG